jgi:predicted Zn-ribbon and HTH transcriptional regulator
MHPTQKPVDLLEYLLSKFSDEHATVLDPFMGSGSTGVACKNLNRDFIGIELDETYFNIAKDRIIDPETSDQIKEALGICDENDREREEGEDLVVTVPECVDCETFLVSNAMRINFCPNCESKT